MSFEVKESYGDAIRAIEAYQKATRKDLPDIMNRFNRNTAFRTIRKLKSTTKAKLYRFNPEKKGSKRNKAPRLFYALSAQDGYKRGQGIKEEAMRRFQARDRSRGFLKAIFLKIASDYGAKMRTRVNLNVGGEAGKSRGIKATIMKLRAEMITGLAEPGALKEIDRAFRLALVEATRDMETYAKKKMDQNAGKYSGTVF